MLASPWRTCRSSRPVRQRQYGSQPSKAFVRHLTANREIYWNIHHIPDHKKGEIKMNRNHSPPPLSAIASCIWGEGGLFSLSGTIIIPGIFLRRPGRASLLYKLYQPYQLYQPSNMINRILLPVINLLFLTIFAS